MRYTVWLLVVTALGSEALADPPATPPAPPAPVERRAPTLEQAAESVLGAIRGGDSRAVAALGSADDPDPWRVADELLRRGERTAADAFARSAPRPDTEGLAAYVAPRTGPSDARARRPRLEAASAALATKDARAALEAIGQPEEPIPRDVIGVRTAMARGGALVAVGRAAEGVVRWRAAA